MRERRRGRRGLARAEGKKRHARLWVVLCAALCADFELAQLCLQIRAAILELLDVGVRDVLLTACVGTLWRPTRSLAYAWHARNVASPARPPTIVAAPLGGAATLAGMRRPFAVLQSRWRLVGAALGRRPHHDTLQRWTALCRRAAACTIRFARKMFRRARPIGLHGGTWTSVPEHRCTLCPYCHGGYAVRPVPKLSQCHAIILEIASDGQPIGSGP